MKKLLIIPLLIISLIGYSQEEKEDRKSFISYPEDDIRTQFYNLIDPTLTDEGFQTGFGAVMIMEWGFVGAETTMYQTKNLSHQDKYKDIVLFLGLNWHHFDYEPIRFYAGIRGGSVIRDTTYGLVGIMVGFDYRIIKAPNGFQMHLGGRLWIDRRNDQEDRAYGDSSAYKKGLITNNPLLQENGALLISLSF